MLKKLIKYDLLPILKFISIFYLLGIFFGILTRIFLNIENSFIINIIGQITSGATIAMIINIFINNIMRLWVRFKNTFYDDESYLTHTLPTDKKTLYLSKFITSIIIFIISFIVSLLIVFITYYSKDNITTLKNMLLPITNILNIDFIKLLFILLILLFLEFFSIIMCGYLGIIIGHRFNNKKIIKSIISGFIIYILTQTCVLLSIFISGLINKDILNLFTNSTITDVSLLKTLSYISIISYSILIIINLIVSIKIFKKGVNID